jgi:hypothetical protein
MADTVAPMITDARAESLPSTRLSSMPDMSDPTSSIVASDGTSAALVLQAAPAHAVAVAYQGLAHSLSLLMLGDTNAHNAFAATSNAIVASTVNLLLGKGGDRG